MRKRCASTAIRRCSSYEARTETSGIDGTRRLERSRPTGAQIRVREKLDIHATNLDVTVRGTCTSTSAARGRLSSRKDAIVRDRPTAYAGPTCGSTAASGRRSHAFARADHLSRPRSVIDSCDCPICHRACSANSTASAQRTLLTPDKLSVLPKQFVMESEISKNLCSIRCSRSPAAHYGICP